MPSIRDGSANPIDSGKGGKTWKSGDTIQSDDIRCDGWIDKDTAEASIRQTEATLKRYTPVYDAQCKEYPRGVEPFRDCIFAEWHVDTDEVVYWLDLDNDILLVTDEIGCARIDDMVRDICRTYAASHAHSD